jgi:TRAP-type transport system periplasmic protein
MRLVGAAVIAAASVVASLEPLRAQSVIWELVNEYPASVLAGDADVSFAEQVKLKTNSKVVIKLIQDAKSGLRTREQLKAVSDGRYAMANSFGGALGDENTLFLLSSLPLVAPSAAGARELFDAARPLYDKAFAERGQKLLYVSPWPPSGIWSAFAVDSPAALKRLKIRTYDTTGTDVFSKVAESAIMVSFADLNPKLESGEINAVLSSGDGGAGRQLWRHLPYFSEILYAIPLSFGSVSLDAWNALEESTRATILDMARETTDRQWAAMANRTAQNFARMRENNVKIDEKPSAEVLAALRSAAEKSIAEWQSRASPEATALLAAYRARTAR